MLRNMTIVRLTAVTEEHSFSNVMLEWLNVSRNLFWNTFNTEDIYVEKDWEGNVVFVHALDSERVNLELG